MDLVKNGPEYQNVTTDKPVLLSLGLLHISCFMKKKCLESTRICGIWWVTQIGPRPRGWGPKASTHLQWSCPGEEGVFASSLVILWGNKISLTCRVPQTDPQLWEPGGVSSLPPPQEPCVCISVSLCENSLAMLSSGEAQHPPSTWPSPGLFYMGTDEWHWSSSKGRLSMQGITHGLRAVHGWAQTHPSTAQNYCWILSHRLFSVD